MGSLGRPFVGKCSSLERVKGCGTELNTLVRVGGVLPVLIGLEIHTWQ